MVYGHSVRTPLIGWCLATNTEVLVVFLPDPISSPYLWLTVSCAALLDDKQRSRSESMSNVVLDRAVLSTIREASPTFLEKTY